MPKRIRFLYVLGWLYEMANLWQQWLNDEDFLTAKGKALAKKRIDEINEAIKYLKEAK